MAAVKYLSIEDVLHIRDQLAEQLGEPIDILRFQQLLSALAAPQQIIFGEELFPTLCAKAGMLLTALIRNHPFWDANKRIALAATREFLVRNGYKLTATNTEAEVFSMRLAQNQADATSAAHWLEAHSEAL